MTEKVLVTGASGYIASHAVNQLLLQNYFVRGTVRSLVDAKKVEPIKQLGAAHNDKLELVEADLLDEPCWLKAVEGCDFVLHMASPFPNANPKTEGEIIEPAVQGTLNVLKACASTDSVKRVVLTSSVAAISSGHNTGNLLVKFKNVFHNVLVTVIGNCPLSGPFCFCELYPTGEWKHF